MSEYQKNQYFEFFFDEFRLFSLRLNIERKIRLEKGYWILDSRNKPEGIFSRWMKAVGIDKGNIDVPAGNRYIESFLSS